LLKKVNTDPTTKPHPLVSGPVAAPIRPRRSVAVLGFKNLSGRPDVAWLAIALSEMLTTELAAGEQLRTIHGENVAQAKINLTLPEADSFGKETLAFLRVVLRGILRKRSGSNLFLGSSQVTSGIFGLPNAAIGLPSRWISPAGQLVGLISFMPPRRGSTQIDKEG
jgi:hypothetical protein